MKHNQNIKKRNLIICLNLFLILIYSIPVVSLGIAPSKKVVDFEPNFQHTFTGLVINNEGKNLQLELSKNDPYNIIKLDLDFIKMSPSEKEKPFNYTINLPNQFNQSGEVASIRVMEKSMGIGISSQLILEFPIIIKQNNSLQIIEPPKINNIPSDLNYNLNNQINFTTLKNISEPINLQVEEKIDYNTNNTTIKETTLNSSLITTEKSILKNISNGSIKLLLVSIACLLFLFLLLLAIKINRD